MKNIYSYMIVLFSLFVITSCENQLQIVQPGATSVENFYKTDQDAQEAIAAVYNSWRSTLLIDYYVKNLLSDDVFCGGGSRGDNSIFEQINEYNFGPANSYLSTTFSSYYNIIYLANLIINRIEPDSEIKNRAIAEAKTIRATIYFDLVTLWGSVPLVTTELTPEEFQQPNGSISAIWDLIESDYRDAIQSNSLPAKDSDQNISEPARLTVEAAKAFLGRAQLFQDKNQEALTTLNSVIDSGSYALLDDYENLLRAVNDFSDESIFEFNSINDKDNPDQGNTIWGILGGFRSDKLDLSGFFSGAHPIYPAGWGFGNPTKKLYETFVEAEGADGYRLNSTIKTYKQLNDMTIELYPGSSLYGSEGYFNWKHRYDGAEVIDGSFGLNITANYNIMRYAEVLLLAAEAAIKSGDQSTALLYINQIRKRALLDELTSLTMDDIKLEKRLELCFEGKRFQDLVRWGDTHFLADQGAKIPVLIGLNNDNTNHVDYPYTNQVYGFKTGKHELLPFPEHEMNVNQKIKQNPGW